MQQIAGESMLPGIELMLISDFCTPFLAYSRPWQTELVCEGGGGGRVGVAAEPVLGGRR